MLFNYIEIPPSTEIVEAPSPAPIPPSVIHAETAEPLFITRCLYIKDFSLLLGDHGGILDRLDSMFFVAIIFQIYLIKFI